MEKNFKNIEKHKISEEKIQIFSKIENIEEEKEITNFEKLNLKVGKIFKIEKVENSEKLYVLQIDFKDEKRQIVSGLQKIYKIEELQNRKIVAILNLKKAKLAGVESQGMVLAVDNPSEGDDCELLNSDLEIGEYLKIKEKVANSKKEIKNSKFSKFNFQAKENEIFFEDEKIEKVFTKKNFLGKVH